MPFIPTNLSKEGLLIILFLISIRSFTTNAIAQVNSNNLISASTYNAINNKGTYVGAILIDSSVDRTASKAKRPIHSYRSFLPIVNIELIDTLRQYRKDRDGDGIVDSLDKCPDMKGVLEYDGCPMPDTDNDGLADDIDQCPIIAGSLKYKGCPPPDNDGDKINDEDDKCPGEPGVARYAGCPVKDTDGDGVNDDDDKCINTPGSLNNSGCPETKMTTPVKKIKERKSL